MFPLKDENPTSTRAVVTGVVILTTIAAWGLVQGFGVEGSLVRSICRFGVIPAELLGRAAPGTEIPLGRGYTCALGDSAPWLTLFSSIFMHGGWFHLIGNMWFLWVFGNNIEDVMGHGRFVVFYLLTGVAAALAQVFAQPSSPVPMVGASGAISGVMGAYVVLFPRVRVHTVIFLGFFITRIEIPAAVMLGYWFLLQVVGGIPSLAGGGGGGGVAFLAHAGGFVAGAALIYLFARPDRLRPKRHARVLVRRR
jgi:membrane associated rhomboid family serine protease